MFYISIFQKLLTIWGWLNLLWEALKFCLKLWKTKENLKIWFFFWTEFSAGISSDRFKIRAKKYKLYRAIIKLVMLVFCWAGPVTCWQTDAAKNLALFPNRLAPSKPITDSSQFVYYSTSATTRYCACSTTLLYCLRQNRLQKPLLSSLRWWSKNSFNRNSHNTKTLLKRLKFVF